MAVTYSSEFVPLQPATLGNPEFRAIGRIIRACAEIEDLVSLFIAKVAGMKEGTMVTVLGQTPISKKISIADYLAQMHDQEAAKHFRECFNDDFNPVLKCRNAVAHGILLGRSDSGRWAFLTAISEPAIPGSAVQNVISFTTSDLQDYAKAAELAASGFEWRLELKEQRAKRHGRPLLPHRKAQKKGKRGG